MRVMCAYDLFSCNDLSCLYISLLECFVCANRLETVLNAHAVHLIE